MVMECKVTVRKSHYPKDVPFEVPEGWVWCSLKDVCTKIVDGDHNPPASEKGPTEYLMISSKNILDGNLANLKDVRYLSRSVFQSCNQRTDLQLGDILLTTVGTLGRSCIFQGGHKLTFQRSVSVISPLINVEYIKVFFDSEYYQRYIEDNARGTAQKGFYLNQLESSLIPVPPIAEQKRIVDKANLFLVLCQEIQKSEECIHADIEKAKASILVLATHGELVPQDPSEEPALDLLKRINPGFHCSHNLHYEGTLPQGWIVCTLGEISNYGQCVSVSVDEIDETAWVLELEDIEKDTGRVLQRLTKKDRSISGIRHKFQRGQLLFSKLRTYLNKVLIAYEDGFCTTEIIPITPINGIDSSYLNIVLRSPYFLNYTARCGHGVKMPRLGTNDARKAVIPIPPIKEQHRIVQKTEGLFSELEFITTLNNI